MRLKIFSILLGFFVSMIVFGICQYFNSRAYPPALELDPNKPDPELIRKIIEQQPKEYFVALIASRALAVFIASLIACFLRGKAWLGAAVIPAVMYMFLALLAHQYGGYPDWFPKIEMASLLPAGFLAYLVVWMFLGNEFANVSAEKTEDTPQEVAAASQEAEQKSGDENTPSDDQAGG